MKPMACLSISALLVTGLDGFQAEAPRLELGKPLARDIAASDTHTYRVTLEAGQAMHVVVIQQGVDVVLTVLDTAAQPLVRVDSPTAGSGPESAWMIAAAAGTYQIVVRPFDQNATGRYEVRLDAVRAATAEDRRRVALQASAIEAERLGQAPGNQAAAIARLKEAITEARALGEDVIGRTATQSLATISIDEAMTSMRLTSRPGALPVYYSPSYERRAANLAERLEKGVRFFERTLGLSPKIGMVVLSRDDWDWLAPLPYPTNWSRYVRGTGLVGMPGEEEVANVYIPAMRATVPAATIQGLEAGGLRFDDAIRAQFDDFVYHELGHVYTFASGIGTPSLWLGELLADYLSIAHAAQDPVRANGRKFEDLGLDWLDKNVKPKYTALADFDRVWVAMPPENYAWYHAQLTRRARAVYEAQGLTFLKQVKDAFPENDKRPASSGDILTRLEQIAPGFAQWAAALSR
jgi:hypothetical protein